MAQRRETNAYLAELRTVRSRAKTALLDIKGYPTYYEDNTGVDEWFKRYKPTEDHDEMVAALESVVALLDRWA